MVPNLAPSSLQFSPDLTLDDYASVINHPIIYFSATNSHDEVPTQS